MSLNILLLSTSQIKSEAIIEQFKKIFNKEIKLTTFDCSGCKLPEQPLIDGNNDGHYFAKERMNYASKFKNFDDYDYVVSMESGITINWSKVNLLKVNLLKVTFVENETNKYVDICYILIYHQGLLSRGMSSIIHIPEKYHSAIELGEIIKYNAKIYGYNKTIGEIIHEDDSQIDPKNWMKTLFGIDRKDQIMEGLGRCLNNLNQKIIDKTTLLKAYKAYFDFPIKNVLFQDVFPLFKNPYMLKLMVRLIADHYQYDCLDYIVGLEARGFCIGVLIAYELGIGFIPIRKEGKLPGKTVKYTYVKEYGKDTSEIQCDDINDINDINGKRVLVIDDLIATGGTMKAAIELLKTLECEIVDCCVLREVSELKDVYMKTLDGYKCTVLLQ